MPIELQTLHAGATTLTRLSYVDVAVPAEVVGLSASDLAPIAWREPLFSDEDRVRVGAAVWIADCAGARVAVDPFQAADAVLRADRASEIQHQTAIAGLLAAAGFPRESVTLLVLTHIEGVGMVAWRDDDGDWTPFFPNARVLLSDAAMAAFLAAPPSVDVDIEREAWQSLIAQDRVGTFLDGAAIVPGLTAQVLGAHCPGHAVLHFATNDRESPISMIGHLAVSPLHLVTGECAALHADPKAAWSVLRALADDGRTLIGPLWPSPGYGRFVGEMLVTEGA